MTQVGLDRSSGNKTRMVGVAVIGVGRIGEVHATNLAHSVNGARLVGVYDRDAVRATAFADRLGGGLRTYESLAAIWSDREVDAVAICSSTDTHADLTMQAAQAGKHVFCEKPIDLDVSKIRKALAVVETAGIKLQLGFNRRFDPSFRRVAELVRQGKVGQPHLVRITSRDPAPPPASYVKVSGGMFLDMTVHDFDMARYLVDQEVVEVFAHGAVLVDPAIGEQGDIDTATVSLRYKSGALATIDNSRKAVYGYDQRVEVFGSEGCAQAANVGPNQTEHWTSAGLRRDLPLHFFIERYREAFLSELREFVECVGSDRAPSVSGRDGLESALIALAAKRSLELNRPVAIAEMR